MGLARAQIGDLVFSIDDGALDGRVIEHLEGFIRDEGSREDPVDLAWKYARISGDQLAICRAHKEVYVGMFSESGSIHLVARLRATSSSTLRRLKWWNDWERWRTSRFRLLLRFGLEHPLMSLLDLRYGYLTLHAAAVVKDDKACLILGPNGSGKTSTASSLIEDYGYRLLADNFVPTNGTHALGFPGLPRPKDGLAKALHSPIGGRFEIKSVIMMSDKYTEKMSSDITLRELSSYYEQEREDHRDTRVFSMIRDSGAGAPTASDCVIKSLMEIPGVRFNWRKQTLAELMQGPIW